MTSADPSLVGIGVMEFSAPVAATVTQIMRNDLPHTLVVWGGIHATTAPEECLHHADYVCVGEGEQTLLDIAEALKEGQSLEGICNLCYLRDGEIVRNPLHPLQLNLDQYPISGQIPPSSFVLHGNKVIPLSSRLLRRYRTYRGGVYKLMISRGCPHNCTYCVNHLLRARYGQWPMRWRSVNHVIRELEAVRGVGPRIDFVDISDDCFLSADIEYINEFARKYKARIGVPFIIKGTPRYFSREKMDLLYGAGLAWVNMGLQSGSKRICQDVFKRNVFPEEFLATARLVSEYRVAAYYDVIVDNPFETLEDRLSTIEVLMQTPKPFYLLLFSLRFYKGTTIRTMAEELGASGEWIDDLSQDYRVRDATLTSDLLAMTPLLPSWAMIWLLRSIRDGSTGIWFRLLLFLAKFYARFVSMPVNSWRLSVRSQQGNALRALRAFPTLAAGGLVYYLNNFRWFEKAYRLSHRSE